MEKLGLVVLTVAVIVAGISSVGADFAWNSRKFGIKLYKTVSDGAAGNIIISPMSIQIALALLYAGSDGNTARELAQGLYFDANEYVVAENHKSLLDHHARSGVVKIANKIYLERSFHVLPQFSQIASTKFYSEAETIDTSDGGHAAWIINSWVEEKTNNKIKDLVSAGDVQFARSVIVNAVHFKADWINAFVKSATTPQRFWLSQTRERVVDMMHQTDYFPYAEYVDFKVIKLDYKNSDISFVVLLPNGREGLWDIESRFAMDTADLGELLWHLRVEKVILHLPKFKSEFSARLQQTLTKMGMGTMFTDSAEFQKLSAEPLKVGSVIHKAVIEVDETGTEAAAATAIVGVQMTAALPMYMPREKLFIAEHPFFYFLIDSNGHVLFMGRYVG